MHDPRIIVALDVSTEHDLRELVKKIPNTQCRAKIGKELFTSVGPLAIEICHDAGFEVFLDLKFHDIPNTCAKAVRAAARWGVWMTNIHCFGGTDMMRAARKILEGEDHRPRLIGVTVLTSLSEMGLQELGVSRDLESQVDHLARLAYTCGLDGVVCSAQEVELLRREMGPNFNLVVPGIRPAGAARDDQKRVMTPEAAIAAGADILVIGRAITQNPDPGRAAQAIADSLGMGE